MTCVHPGARSELQRRLLDWYSINRRDLPWRGRTDPYSILVSEVMLQQTGVDRVAAVYERFLERFPTFESLAEAPRWEVLRAWAGLGYNRRAVHLHECAKLVASQYAGKLPGDPEVLRRLPGLGTYTVAAILSIAFQQDVPALDTNIRRVVGRITLGRPASDREIQAKAAELVPSGQSSDWNQALMDFGSLVCTATNPHCPICPVRDHCVAVSDSGSLQTREPRKIAEREEPYRGSRRYFRGRIVARLRDLAPGEAISARELLRELKPDGTDDDTEWIESIVDALAEEGLATVSSRQGTLWVAAPT